MSHSNLEMVKRCRDLMMEIYKLTLQLSGLQNFNEEQPSGSSPAPGWSIFKGAEQRRYSYEFFKFMFDSQASEDLNIERMENFFGKGSLTDEKFYEALKIRFEYLVRIVKGFNESEDFLPA